MNDPEIRTSGSGRDHRITSLSKFDRNLQYSNEVNKARIIIIITH